MSYTKAGTWQNNTTPPAINATNLANIETGIYAAHTEDTIAALKALSTSTLSTGVVRNVLGYYAANDGGGGLFRYNSASSATDNGGTIIAPNTGSGRWERVYTGPVYARWFGARGDGSTDDTTALAAAISYSPKVLELEGLTYKVTYLTVTGSIQIRNGRLLNFGTVNPDWAGCLKFNAQADLVLDRVTIELDSSASAGTLRRGLTILQCKSARLVGCVFKGWTEIAAYITGANGTTRNVYVDGCTFDTNNTDARTTSDPSDDYGALHFGTATGKVRVSNSYFTNGVTGISILSNSTSTNKTFDVLFEGNQIDVPTSDTDSAMGIYCVGWLDNLAITNNVISGALAEGIMVSGSTDSSLMARNIVVSSNLIYDCQYAGISLYFGMENAIVEGNEVHMTTSLAPGHGILIDHITDCVCADNVVKVYASVSLTSAYGIYINQSHGTVVTGNRVAGTLQVSIFIQSSNYVAISSNTLSVAAGEYGVFFAMATFTYGACSVTSNIVAGTNSTSLLLIDTEGFLLRDSVIADNVLSTGQVTDAIREQSTYTDNREISVTGTSTTKGLAQTPKVLALTSDVTNATTSYADITGLTFPVTSGVVYRFRALIIFTVNAATTGSAWSVSGPATPTQLAYTVTYPSVTATYPKAPSLNSFKAYNSMTATTDTPETTGNIAEIRGIIQPSANGTFALRFASEVAVASGVVAKTGSTLEWW